MYISTSNSYIFSVCYLYMQSILLNTHCFKHNITHKPEQNIIMRNLKVKDITSFVS